MTENELLEIGLIGLGVMGRNLVLNMSDHGYSVAGFDRDDSKIEQNKDDMVERKVFYTAAYREFLKKLQKPRSIILLVPAGGPVDAVINELLPYLEPDDLIIDAGNSHFIDTNRRATALHAKKIKFIGMGVSGGEEGARFGPSIMPGGAQDAYDRVAEVLKAVSAKVGGDPCVTYLGPGSAGHYVKMVHNGIEYALMQLIAETYDLLKLGLGLNNDELHEIYAEWNDSELSSFLIEITSKIFSKQDDKSDSRLIDMILDAAKQKGTGMWTTQDAMNLQVPIPTIDSAVAMRDLSACKPDRVKIEKILSGPEPKIKIDKKEFTQNLKNAFRFAMIIAYAQGMSLLRKASEKYEYNLNLKDVAKIWRGGCIIRSSFLEDIMLAFEKSPALHNLMTDPDISKVLIEKQAGLRAILTAGIAAGIPVPGLSASLAYYDSFRRSRLPANLIQAQRDFFGAHTYERIDEKGVFHAEWEKIEGA